MLMDVIIRRISSFLDAHHCHFPLYYAADYAMPRHYLA